MKKIILYYTFCAVISGFLSLVALWSFLHGILPTFMFAMLIVGSLGSLGISCYEIEQNVRSNVHSKSKSKWS